MVIANLFKRLSLDLSGRTPYKKGKVRGQGQTHGKKLFTEAKSMAWPPNRYFSVELLRNMAVGAVGAVSLEGGRPRMYVTLLKPQPNRSLNLKIQYSFCMALFSISLSLNCVVVGP